MDGLFPMAPWLIFWDREVEDIADSELLSQFDGKGDDRSIFDVRTHRRVQGLSSTLWVLSMNPALMQAL